MEKSLNKKQLIFLIFTVILIITSYYLTRNMLTPFVQVIDYQAFSGESCATVKNSKELILNKNCKSIVIKNNIFKSSKSKLFIISKVKSSQPRTGVHVEYNNKWNYSYHTGDNTDQFLYMEIDNPVNSFNLHLSFNENILSSDDEVTFGEIIISDSIDYILNKFPQFKTTWVRTNNPNHDFWFNRFTSLTTNLTITIPNENNMIWENYFGIGINDRNNTGDYYCFPDDKLLILYKNKEYWVYLGFLKWTRKINSSNNFLQVEFNYEGPLKISERVNQEHAQKTKEENFSKEIELSHKLFTYNLKKIYFFDLNSKSHSVKIDATIHKNLKPVDFMWIVEDAAYMDFKVGNFSNVHSLFNKSKDHVYFKSSNNKFTADKLIQYRIRSPDQEDLASFYSSEEVNINYITDSYLQKFLESRNISSKVLFSNEKFLLQDYKKLDKSLIFGIGFKSNNGTISSTYKMNILNSIQTE
ncbi:MAG: hypothetical protein J0M15_07855 [Deltaproteobacteria bacterium]|nr:hypothetical protein [Deltaproteobacteria bacterium]